MNTTAPPEPTMPEQATLTPLDVAVELVATKLALVNIVATLVGTSPALPIDAELWAHESPLELCRDPEGWLYDGVSDRVFTRAEEIERRLLAAAATYLLERVQVGAGDG